MEPPKIEFPCEYPVKVMGANVENFERDILLIFRRHAPDLVDTNVSSRVSSTGRWVSLTVTITATGAPQLEALFVDLKGSGLVTLVL